MKLKKLLAAGMIAVLAMGALTACGGNDEPADEEGGDTAAAMTGDISVLTREDGSGTRSAFIELFGIEGEDGTDNTIAEAEVTNSTSVMMQTVSGNKQAIGYVSLGSLDESLVKALKVDGVEATAENVKSGDYKLQRPFNIVTNGEVGELPQDFIDFIMSADGQAIIEEEGLQQISDTNSLAPMIQEIIDSNPKSVADYKAGKKKALGFFVGQVMKATKGQANPGVVNQMIVELLEKIIVFAGAFPDSFWIMHNKILLNCKFPRWWCIL